MGIIWTLIFLKGKRGSKLEGVEGASLAPATDDVLLEIERERSGSVCSRQSDVNVKRKRRNEMSECVDDMMRMKLIGVKLRRFLFAEGNKISKSASEFILNCVGEYEEQMMKLIDCKVKWKNVCAGWVWMWSVIEVKVMRV